ncbi:MAG: XRE family transcriptional regulator [Alphaproteobacteria bacterium]|nr:MAG: XRE family transcriptional regulator [Alphaproteobacteria bacterium]
MTQRKSRSVDVDRHVGQRIRHHRVMLGLTQQQLAEMIGVTYQQAHKYERGINRVSAGRLYEIARVFGVGVDTFYEGLDQTGANVTNARQRLSLELVRSFGRINNPRHQEALAQMARALADSEEHAAAMAAE